nr:hypothetical protein [Tanacetum cinerariifolium]
MFDASSAVTYTSVYTDSEPWRYYGDDLAETGPKRVIVYGYDGLPIQPVAPPSPDYVPGPEHPPSPDYVPGPEHPPSPIEIPYVPEPEYPEDAENARYRGRDNGNRPAREEDEKALAVQDELGYDSQFNENEVLDVKEEEATETVFDNHSSDEENSLANDMFKKGKGFHAVPPPLIGNYMPPKPNLSFTRLDDFICKFKISETVTSLSKDVKDAPETSTTFVEKPKEVRTSAPLIQEWDTNSDNDNVFRPKHIPAKINFVKSVFTRSGRIPVSAAKPKAAASTSTTKLVNTVGPKQSVNVSNSRSTFHKSHSPIRRSFYNATTHSRSNSSERVNTAGSKAVSAVKGNGVTAVKASAGCVWRPRVNEIDQIFKDNSWICTLVDYGHPQQALKNKRIFDSGCSRHMTGNKAYLADY